MNRSIQLLVFVFAIGLALLSAFVIAMNWICLVVSIRTKRFRSPVPLVGGFVGIAACAIGGWFYDVPVLRRVFWLPLLLDPTWILFAWYGIRVLLRRLPAAEETHEGNAEPAAPALHADSADGAKEPAP